MSKNKTKSRKILPEKKRISRKIIIAICVVVVVCIVATAVFVVVRQGPLSPEQAKSPVEVAGEYYCMSVDLAYAGNYSEALQDADFALAQNVSSLIPIIQSNRAGILVELGRNNDAISAADVAINATGNLTTLKSIAWYWKARAFQDLNMTSDAASAYANASAPRSITQDYSRSFINKRKPSLRRYNR